MSEGSRKIEIPVTLDPGAYQWVRGKGTGADDKQPHQVRQPGLSHMEGKVDRVSNRGTSTWRLTSAALALALVACASGGGAPPPPAPKPEIPPQVAYRIDDHRYFEITPDKRCYGDMLYFVDTVKGIRSKVVAFDAVMNGTTLIIDAANDQYLVAPVTRGGINCSSGGGACAAASMPYSTDGGRTWTRAWSPGTTYDLMVSGSTAYQSHRNVDMITQGFDLTLPRPQSNYWKYLDARFVFKARIPPVDTKVRCKAESNGSSQ